MLLAPDRQPPSAAASDAHLAFEALFRAHFDFVYANLRRLGVAPAAVDDAAQDVFLVVLRRAGAPVASIRGWLYGIVRRIAWRHRRSSARQHRLAQALTVEPRPAPDLPAAIHDREARLLLDRFLAGLDDAKREVFVLAELEQMTAPEIARALEIKENTVYSRLRAARHEFERSVARLQVRDERERLLARARRAHDPSPATRQQAWICLWGHLGTGAGEATLSPALAGSQAIATTVTASGQTAWALVIGALGVLVVTAGPPRAGPPAAPQQTAEIAHLEPEVIDAPAPSSALALAIPPAAAPAAAPASIKPRDRPRPLPVVEPVVTPPVTHVLEDIPAPPPPPALDPDALAREAALMSRARAELRAGAWDQARLLLVLHAREFPAGALVEERQLSLLSALCAGGERDAHRLEQARLLRAHPGTALARKALAPCASHRKTLSTTRGPSGD